MEIRGRTPLVILLFMVLGSHSGAFAYEDLEERIEELELKVEQVEERLERQEDFTEDVHEAFPSVFQNGAAARRPSTTASPATTSATTPLVYTQSDFVATVIDVTRTRTSSGYRFKVRYIPHAQNLRVVYVFDFVDSETETYDYLHELVPTSEPHGVMSVTFEKGLVSQDYVDQTFVYFMAGTERVGIKVFMRPGLSGNLYTRLHAWPLTVSPDELLVYPQGANTPLLDVQYTNSTSSVRLNTVMLNLATGKAALKEGLDHSPFFDTTISTKYDSSREKRVQGRVKTSRYSISGYINVIATEYFYSNSSAVETVEVKKRLTFRPTNQAGPFPDGYLGFLKVQGLTYNNEGTQIHTCNITDNQPCRKIVDVVTESSIQLTCSEVMSNGHTHPLAVTPPSNLEFNSDVRKYLFTIQPMSQSQNSSIVRCTAVNETGFQVQKTMKVMYFVQPRILEDKSSVQNGSHVTVSCVATGHPLPSSMYVYTVNQDLEQGYGLHHSYSIGNEDLVTSADGQEVTGVLTFPYDPVNPLTLVICSASNGFDYVSEDGYASNYVFTQDHATVFSRDI